MKKNFAGQPEGGGQIRILTANDLQFDVKPQPPVFKKQPLFVDNCKNCNMKIFKNVIEEYGAGAYGDYGTVSATTVPEKKGGGFFSGINLNTILGTATTGAGIWAQQQQNRSAAEQAQYALQIENQRLQQERERARTEEAKAEAEAAKAGSLAGRIKAYGLPIAITGVLVIGGIAAYFYFKKKKVS
jgi:hypothetical protein